MRRVGGWGWGWVGGWGRACADDRRRTSPGMPVPHVQSTRGTHPQRAHTETLTQTRTQPCTHTQRSSHKHARTQATHAHTETLTQTRSHTGHKRTHRHAHKHARTQPCTHTQTRTPTRSHTAMRARLQRGDERGDEARDAAGGECHVSQLCEGHVVVAAPQQRDACMGGSGGGCVRMLGACVRVGHGGRAAAMHLPRP